MIRLLLVRHGETKLNSLKCFQGQSNPDLNAPGVEQANALAQFLADVELHALYCSEQKRALQTADRIISFHNNLSMIVEPRLREINFGLWEGLTLEEIQIKYPTDWAAWQDDLQSAPTGGETFLEVRKRTNELLDVIRSQHPDQTVLIVAHAGVLEVLIYQALEILPRMRGSVHLYTASLSELWLYEHGASLIHLNDLSALEHAGIPIESVYGR